VDRPVVEELLYRERIWDALGAVPLLIRGLVTSALFALPHVEAWSVLGTFLVGAGLALTRAASRSLGFCVALHAGLNLGGLIGPTALGIVGPAIAGGAAYLLAAHMARAEIPGSRYEQGLA